MGELRSVIKRTILGAKKSVAQIADEMGCSESILYRYGLDGESGAEMPLSRLIPLMRATDDYRILRHIAARCDHVAVKVRRVAALKKKDPAILNEIQGRFAKMMADFCAYTAEASEAETLGLLDTIARHLADVAAMKRAVKDYRQEDLFA